MRTRIFNNKWLALLIVIVLAVMPFAINSPFFLSLLIQVFIYAVYGMSYDLLLGYTGIVSFGHAVFFGTGAYAVGILLSRENNPNLLWLAFGIAIIASILIALLIGALTLRVKDVYFSMLTLAVAELFAIGAEKLNNFTGGDDGIPYIKVSEFLQDRTNFYYVALVFLIVMFLILRRIVHSPLGRTLQAIRENEQRVQSLGYNVLQYKLVSIIISGVAATLAGGMWAVFQQYVNTSVYTLDTTLDALLITIIGGVGTLVGPIFGSAVITFAHEWLSDLAGANPIFERWLLFFGIIYIVIVMFFPKGIIGSVREKWLKIGGDSNGVQKNQQRKSVL